MMLLLLPAITMDCNQECIFLLSLTPAGKEQYIFYYSGVLVLLKKYNLSTNS